MKKIKNLFSFFWDNLYILLSISGINTVKGTVGINPGSNF